MKNISANDIKKQILIKLNKVKFLIIILSVIAVFALGGGIVSFICPYMFSSSVGKFKRIIGIIACAVMVIILIILLFKYFRGYYKIKNEKFVIITEKLYHKSVEDIKSYKHVRTENVFYFKSGKIFVETSMYKNAKIGDEFYLVMLDDKAPFYIYDKKHYKIDM